MNSTTKIQLTELNPHLICVLCGGYLIDATTIIECIHSFCRTCIIRYLESSKYCPICDVQVHKTKPLTNVRSDKTLQTLVYKLVPGLFKDEMRRRREFYASNQDGAIEVTSHSVNTSELRGEVQEEDDVSTKSDDEKISICLQHCVKLPPYKNDSLISTLTADPDLDHADRRYLLCPAGVTIGHLKKLIRMKFDLPNSYRLEIFYSDESLRDGYTLLDVAHIYAWRRMEPLKLYYIVYDQTVAQLHLTPPSVKDMARYLPETPAEARKRVNRKRRQEAEQRKVHEISDSEPSDNESKKEEKPTVDSSVVILSGADSDGHPEGPNQSTLFDNKDNSASRVPDSVSDPVKCETEQLNEAKDGNEVMELCNEAEKKVDVIYLDKDSSEQNDGATEKCVASTSASSLNSPSSTPVPEPQSKSFDVVIIDAVTEKSSESESLSQPASAMSNETEHGSTPSKAKVNNGNGIVSSDCSSSEKAKTPKSKSINDVVSKIKAKSNPSDQVVILDILPGVVPMDISESDGNENKQPTSVIKKATALNTITKTSMESVKAVKSMINNNHGLLVVPCDSTSPKPKAKKITNAKSKTAKHSTYLQDSHVVNTTLDTVAKPKKGRKTKLERNDKTNSEPASKKCKVDSTVDLTNCDLLSPNPAQHNDNDIQVVSFELSRDPPNDQVVVLS